MTEKCGLLAVFFVWLLGPHILLVQGMPHRGTGKEVVQTRRNEQSSEPDTFDARNVRHIRSPGAPIKYEIVSQGFVERPKSTDCGDDGDCEQGSEREDRIPIKELLPSLEKEKIRDAFTGERDSQNLNIKYEIISQSKSPKDKDSSLSDTFSAVDSSEGLATHENGDAIFEIISKSMKKEDTSLSGKECDDENECGSADGSGNDITSTKKGNIPVDVFTGEKDHKKNDEIRYVIISQSTASKNKDSKPFDTFTAEESSEDLSSQGKAGVIYEIISKSVKGDDKMESSKNCDDEDECGSADDVFSIEAGEKDDTPVKVTEEKANKENDDIQYVIMSQSNVPKEKESERSDMFSAEETSESLSSQGKAGVIYEIISKSTKIGKKECDDEDECGSGDELFSDDGSGDKKNELPVDVFAERNAQKDNEDTKYVIVFQSTKSKEKEKSEPSDTFTAQETSESLSTQGKAGAIYEIVSKSTKSKDKKLPAKECDDEDECGSANDLFSNDGSGDVITKEFYQSDNKDGVPVDVFTKGDDKTEYIIISQSTTSKEKESAPSDTFTAEEASESPSSVEKDGVIYEIISKSMKSGDKEESKLSDTFRADETSESLSSQGKAGVIYEIISKSVKSGDEKLAGKECDDEEECGSAADVFGNDGSGDVVIREFNKEFKPSDTFTAEEISEGLSSQGKDGATYEIIAKSMKSGDEESRPADTFSAEETSESLSSQGKAGVIYEIILKSTSKDKKLPAKECDDEDECGSADGVFSNDGSGDVITREFSQPKNKDDVPVDVFIEEKALTSKEIYNVPADVFTGEKNNEDNDDSKYEIIFQSTTSRKMPKAEDEKQNSCLPSPCKNDGECVQHGKEYSCVCKGKYRGQNCSEEGLQKPISFHKKSYVRFNKAATLLKMLHGEDGFLTFSILTSKPKGLLLWEGQKVHQNLRKYASIGLTVGFVTLSFNIGTGLRKVYSKFPVDDGVWHSITIERRKGVCALIVDEQYKTEFNSINDNPLVETAVDLYIGGIPNIKTETQGLEKTGFMGCLKNLHLNSKYIDFDRDYIGSQGIGYCGEI